MCLYTGENRPEIAKQDIVCYKAVVQADDDNNMFFGPYHLTEAYPYNTILRAGVPVIGRSNYKLIEYLTVEKDRINAGFHSRVYYRENYYYGYVGKISTKTCIIPKGAEYCAGICSDFVSTHIVVFKNKRRYTLYKIFRPFIRLWWRITNKLPKIKYT